MEGSAKRSSSSIQRQNLALVLLAVVVSSQCVLPVAAWGSPLGMIDYLFGKPDPNDRRWWIMKVIFYLSSTLYSWFSVPVKMAFDLLRTSPLSPWKDTFYEQEYNEIQAFALKAINEVKWVDNPMLRCVREAWPACVRNWHEDDSFLAEIVKEVLPVECSEDLYKRCGSIVPHLS